MALSADISAQCRLEEVRLRSATVGIALSMELKLRSYYIIQSFIETRPGPNSISMKYQQALPVTNPAVKIKSRP